MNRFLPLKKRNVNFPVHQFTLAFLVCIFLFVNTARSVNPENQPLTFQVSVGDVNICQGTPISVPVIFSGNADVCSFNLDLQIGSSLFYVGTSWINPVLNSGSFSISPGGTGILISWSSATPATINGTDTILLLILAPDTLVTNLPLSWDPVSSQVSSCTAVIPASFVNATLTIHTNPIPTIIGPPSTCQDWLVTYSTEVGMTNYLWSIPLSAMIVSGGTSMDNTITLNWNMPGYFVLSVTYNDANLCVGTKNKSILVNASPNAIIQGNPSHISVNASSPLISCIAGPGPISTYSWSYSGTGSLNFLSPNTASTIIYGVSAGVGTISCTATNVNACSSTVSASITIDTLQDASFSYGGITFCQTSPDPTPIITGYPGGTFHSSTPGLVMNAVTGTIDLSASPPNTYSIIYTTPGPNPNSDTVYLTITGIPSASIHYAGTPFCSTISLPQSVTLTGTYAYTGGIYSSLPAGLTLNSVTGAITPNTSTPGNYTVTYTIPASGGCAQVTTTTTATITHLPSASIHYAGTPFCSTNTSYQNVTLTGTFAYTGGTYSALPVGLVIDAVTGAIMPSSSTPGTYTITYTIAAAGGCAIVWATTTVVITALPTVSINYPGSPFCNTANYGQNTITGTGGYFGGIYSAGPVGLSINSNTGAITPNTSSPGTYTVWYTIFAAGGCASVWTTTPVVILPHPTANAGPDTTVCFSGPILLNHSSATNSASFSWGTSGDGGFNNASILHPSYTPGPNDIANTTVNLTLSVNGNSPCAAASDVIVVSMLPQTLAYAGPDAVICAGQNFTPTNATVTNATSFTWSSNGTGTFSTPLSLTPTYYPSAADILAQSVTLYLHATNTQLYCGDFIDSLVLTINPSIPSPAANITGPLNLCQGQNNVIYTVPPIANANSYSWSFQPGFTIVNLNANTCIVNIGTSAVSGNISVYGQNSCGNGLSSSLPVSVSPLPGAPSVIFGNTTPCQGSTATYSIAPVSNASAYTWTLPPGSTGASTSNNISVTFSTFAVSGNISVKGINSCGEGPSLSLPIVVQPLPGAAGPITGPLHVCRGETYTYTVPSIVGATTYTWISPTGFTVLSGTNSISIYVGMTANSGGIAVKGHNSCGDGSISTLYITVDTCVSIDGTVSYPNSTNTPLNNTSLHLMQNNSSIAQTTTNINGSYLFPFVHLGNYTIQSSTTKAWGGSNAVDALKVLKHFVGMEYLNGLFIEAGDVDNSGVLNGVDALMIARRFVGQINSFPTGDWLFENDILNINSASNITHDFNGICYGDVDGSFVPAAKQSPGVELIQYGEIQYNTQDVVGIPLVLNTAIDVHSVSLVLNLENSGIIVKEVTSPNDGILVFRQIQDQLRIAWYSISGIKAGTDKELFTLWIEDLKPQNNWLSIGSETLLTDFAGNSIPGSTITYPKITDSDKELSMGQNTPNPFSLTSQIPYYLPKNGRVVVEVFDIVGREVMRLFNDDQLAGDHSLTIDGAKLTEGVYTYRLTFTGSAVTKFISRRLIIQH